MEIRASLVRMMCLLLSSLLLVLVANPADAKSPPKDRGEASMKIGDTPWMVSRASAYLKQGRLKILASRSKTVGGKRVRQALKLSISDFTGPGTYELENHDSSFSVVGLDLEQIDENSKDAAEKALLGALSKSTVILLKGATVKIESEKNNQVKGTFSWPGRGAQAPITDGMFRAIIKKRE